MTNYHIDALHTVIRNTLWGIPYPDIIAIAKALHEAGWSPGEPPTIDHAEDLDNKLTGTVVIAPDGTVFQRASAAFFCWSSPGILYRASGEDLITQYGNLGLLYTPTTQKETP